MENINPEKVLSEEERNSCKEAFDAFDKFGYGTLNIDEIQKVLEGILFSNSILKKGERNFLSLFIVII